MRRNSGITICLTLICLLSAVSCFANSGELSEEVIKAALRAHDIAECKNLIGWHVWYHGAFMNDIELEKIWVKTPEYQKTAVWAQNAQYWIGMDNIKAYYGPTTPREQARSGFQFHATTTGIVEIAEDRQTAKGAWYTPGAIGTAGNLQGMWERYGIDFVRENGEWKIWHLHVYTDFSYPMSSGGAAGGMGGTRSGMPQGMGQRGAFDPDAMGERGMPQGMRGRGPIESQPAYVGQWDMKVETGGGTFDETMVISQAADGTLSATWSSTMENEVITNLTYDNGTLTFTRSFGVEGQSMTLNFTGTIEGSNLTGSFASDMGEIPVTGTKAESTGATDAAATTLPSQAMDQGGQRGPAGDMGGQRGMGPRGGAERFGMEGGRAGMGGGRGPNIPSQATADPGYSELSANSYADLIPRPPEPYKTFSETWSYGDPDEVKMFGGEYKEWSEIKEMYNK